MSEQKTPIWCYAVWVLGIVSFFVGGPFGMLIAAATVIAIMILWAICTLFVQILYFFIQIYLDYKKFQP
jgi:divalent metal cation (Fe/Co/Zn/Cd) transporter